MKTLKVNGQVVEFQAQNEKTLADMAPSLVDWLRREAQHLKNARIDGQALPQDPLEWPGQALEDFETLELETQDWNTEIIEQLTLVGEFFQVLERILDSPDPLEPLKEWMTDYDLLAPRLPVILQEESLPPDFRLTQLFQRAISQEKPDSTEVRKLTGLLLQRSGNLLDEHLNPLERARLIQERLELYRDSLLSSTSLAFQSGKEALAVAEVQNFLSLVEALARFLERPDLERYWVNGAEKRQKYGQLQEVLATLEEGFRHSDWILLADLLEYEIRPLLEDFLAD